jgi:hypothetical protein
LRKQKPTCFRCGREFEEGETYDLIWVGSGMAPVCHDDKTCEDNYIPRHRRQPHMKVVHSNASRFH